MKSILLITTFILIILSCSLKDKEINTSKRSLTFQKTNYLSDNEIIELIGNLKEVKFEIQRIKKNSNQEREGLIMIWRNAEIKKDSCCWVKVGEDNVDAFATHFNFFVNVVNKEIKYLDVISGDKISLDEWRKIKSRKNKTASNSTYTTTGESTRTC